MTLLWTTAKTVITYSKNEHRKMRAPSSWTSLAVAELVVGSALPQSAWWTFGTAVRQVPALDEDRDENRVIRSMGIAAVRIVVQEGVPGGEIRLELEH